MYRAITRARSLSASLRPFWFVRSRDRGDDAGRPAIRRGVYCVVAVAMALVASTGSARASATREQIVSAAASQLGYSEPGDFCSKYGPCEEWCSLFATWAWEQAGVAIPRFAFVGDMYYWAQARTYVEGPDAMPSPGDAVLFGTGPESVETSLHVGIVEDVYPTGYLVTIEGDALHGVGRYVVPIKDPQSIGEAGPIYADASPVASGSGAQVAGAAAAAAFGPLPETLDPSQEPAPRLTPMRYRNARVGVDWAAVNGVRRRTLRSLRAFQHMPFRAGHVYIDWTGVDRRGLVEVRVSSTLHMSSAREAWQRFLQRFDDAGSAYVVSFQAPPDIPVERSAPSISGTTTQGHTLTASHGSWSNDATSYSYRWEQCDSTGAACWAIGAARNKTYKLTASDVGDAIRVQVTASNTGGASRPATSIPTTVVVSGVIAHTAGQN